MYNMPPTAQAVGCTRILIIDVYRLYLGWDFNLNSRAGTNNETTVYIPASHCQWTRVTSCFHSFHSYSSCHAGSVLVAESRVTQKALPARTSIDLKGCDCCGWSTHCDPGLHRYAPDCTDDGNKHRHSEGPGTLEAPSENSIPHFCGGSFSFDVGFSLVLWHQTTFDSGSGSEFWLE